MSSAFAAEIFEKARQGIGSRLFGQAAETDKLLREFGGKLAKDLGCKAAYGPIKGMERAAGKVASDYGGDWYELKDVVRMTVIAPDMAKLKSIQEQMVLRCVTSEGLKLIKNQEVLATSSACGYSGLNFVVMMRNCRPAEVQANSSQVMYGQLSQENFCATVGAQEYWRIKSKFMIDGGLGHAFYEIYRIATTTENGKRAAILSRQYFNYLRAHPNFKVSKDLENEIRIFKKTNIHAFAH